MLVCHFYAPFRPRFKKFSSPLASSKKKHVCPTSAAMTNVKKMRKTFLLGSPSVDTSSVSKQPSPQDQQYRCTQFGPHRDDFLFAIGSRNLQSKASQGEKRLYMYALKLAFFEYICFSFQKAPMLLLDDVFSDLDPRKIDLLFRFVQQSSQVFLACANINIIRFSS